MLSSETLRAHIPPSIFSSVCTLFADSQHHNTSHRKNIQALKRLYLESLAKRIDSGFFCAFLHCLHVLFGIKKGEEAGGRLIRFTVGFIVVLYGIKLLFSHFWCL
jgi:hypothetical protein